MLYMEFLADHLNTKCKMQLTLNITRLPTFKSYLAQSFRVNNHTRKFHACICIGIKSDKW